MTNPNQHGLSTVRVVPAALLLLFAIMAVSADGVEPDASSNSAKPHAPKQPAAAAEDSAAVKPPAAQEEEPAATEGPAVGSEVPEIEGEDVAGVPLKLSEYRGKVVVLDFWGDW